LETITNYGTRHGQDVTVGMDLANYLSWQFGLLSQGQFDEMHVQLTVNFPYYDFGLSDMDAYFEALSKDKKNIGSNLGCIRTEGPGRLVRKQVPFDDTLREIIRTYFTQPLSRANDNN
jgi:3-dehydroquinate synthase